MKGIKLLGYLGNYPLAFSLVLFGGFAASFFTPPGAVPFENRLRTPPPGWSLTAAPDFPAAFDRYYNDRAGFRDAFVGVHRWLTKDVLKENDLGLAFRGKDGWLFIPESIVAAGHASRFTPDSISGWRVKRQGWHDRLAQRGAIYVFAPVPDKHSVYPEYLPAGAENPVGVTRESGFRDGVRDLVWVADPLPGMLKRKKAGAPFSFRNLDSHWSSFGAYLAYAEIMRSYRAQGGKSPMRELADGEFIARPNTWSDLGNILGLSDVDLDYLPSLPYNVCTQYQKNYAELRASDCKDQPGTVIAFGDSFVEGLVPFLQASFGRIVIVRGFDSTDPRAEPILAKEKPGLVIDEMAERSLQNMVPLQSQAVPE